MNENQDPYTDRSILSMFEADITDENEDTVYTFIEVEDTFRKTKFENIKKRIYKFVSPLIPDGDIFIDNDEDIGTVSFSS